MMLRRIAHLIIAARSPEYRKYLAAKREYEAYLATHSPLDFATLTESEQDQARNDLGLARAAALYEESIQLSRGESARSNAATALYQLGMLRHLQGRIDDATRFFRESLDANATPGSDPGTTAGCRYHLGVIAMCGGSLEQARQHLRASLAINTALQHDGEISAVESALRRCDAHDGGNLRRDEEAIWLVARPGDACDRLMEELLRFAKTSPCPIFVSRARPPIHPGAAIVLLDAAALEDEAFRRDVRACIELVAAYSDFRLFISYARDCEWSCRQASELHEKIMTVEGIDFLDTSSIPEGSNWRKAMTRAVSEADLFVG